MTLPPAPHSTTIVFDLGKVLLDFDYRIAVERFASHSDQSADQILRLLVDTSLLHRYERGELSTTEFFDAVREATGFRAGFDLFTHCFTDIFTPIPSMIELHALLRAAGHPTVLLSNTNELQFRHIARQHPFVGGFDHRILSFEHQAMKPDPALYRVVESVTGHNGRDLVFLDDRADNVQAALALGWRAFVHEDADQSHRHLIELGLLPEPPMRS